MTSVIINPGSGPVADAKKKLAKKAIKAFVADLGLEGVKVERDKQADEDGRFGFVLTYEERSVEVDMPGLELDRVRYVSKDQNPFAFPRLYVDGSSWLWMFAVNIALGNLTDDDEAEVF